MTTDNILINSCESLLPLGLAILILTSAVIILSLVLATVIRMKKQVNCFDKTRIEISDIEILKHECGLGKPAEEMIPTMIQKNDVEVDAVTNATYSSEVIKDAIRNALRNGKRQD